MGSIRSNLALKKLKNLRPNIAKYPKVSTKMPIRCEENFNNDIRGIHINPSVSMMVKFSKYGFEERYVVDENAHIPLVLCLDRNATK